MMTIMSSRSGEDGFHWPGRNSIDTACLRNQKETLNGFLV